MTDGIEIVAHEVRRLAIPVTTTFDEFRARYEVAVPALRVEKLDEFKRAGADWDTVLRATAENAPNGFIRYWGSDVESLMRLAGPSRPCVEYLMGNHTIAQRMYRHNPAVMLHAPLRTVIHQDHADRVWFTLDQPSTCFGSFGDARIAAVGHELDAKVAVLLEVLGLPVPAELAAA